METHRATLKIYFQKQPPATINEAISTIELLTGIKRSPTPGAKISKIHGNALSKSRTDTIESRPRKTSRVSKKKLEPRLEEASSLKRAVFLVDAAHFVMGAFLGMIWCFQRVFIKSPSGRKRFNVLGALNAITHEIITVTNDSYITGTQVGELLRKLADLKLTIPITLVLDNARYQKCKVVQNLAEELGIE